MAVTAVIIQVKEPVLNQSSLTLALTSVVFPPAVEFLDQGVILQRNRVKFKNLNEPKMCYKLGNRHALINSLYSFIMLSHLLNLLCKDRLQIVDRFCDINVYYFF